MGEFTRKADGRRVFTADFKRAALARLQSDGTTVAALSRELGILPTVIRRWIKLAEGGSEVYRFAGGPALEPGAREFGEPPVRGAILVSSQTPRTPTLEIRKIRRTLHAVAAVLLFVPLGGCDPGFHYTPRNWSPRSALTWETVVDSIQIRCDGVSGLTGTTRVSIEFDLRRPGELAVTEAEVVLVARGRRYPGEVMILNDNETSEGGENVVRVNSSWDLPERAHEVLGTEFKVEAGLRVEEAPLEFVVEFGRDG